MSTRSELLEALIGYDRAINEIMHGLYQYPFDTDVDYALFSRDDIISILNRFLTEKLTALEVCEWAEEIEGRQDIRWEPGYSNLISDILNSLTTEQRLGKILKPEEAKRYIIWLNNATEDPKDTPTKPLKRE